PEQATMSQDTGDIRSDVYALGVILYVLLTGRPPISKQQLLEKGLFEFQSILRNYQPATPSVQLTKNQSAAHWSSLPEAKRKGWLASLRGELDWITMKAISKELDQRYDTAADLQDDIENFLNGNPVVARPPSLLYLTSKWIHRHRVVAVIMVSLIVSALVSVGSIYWGYLESQSKLVEVNNANQLTIEKAAELESALVQSKREKDRADRNARRLSSLLKRELLQSSWNFVNDGQIENSIQNLEQIDPDERKFVWQFIRKVADLQPLKTVRPASNDAIPVAATDKTGKRLAVIDSRANLELWDTINQRLIHKIQIPKKVYNCVQFDDSGSRILVSHGSKVELIDLDSRNHRTVYFDHGRGSTRSAAYDSDRKKWILTTGANFVVEMTNEGKFTRNIKLDDRIGKISVSSDSSLASVITADGNVELINMTSFEPAGKSNFPSGTVAQDMTWVGRKLKVATLDRKIFEFDFPVRGDSSIFSFEFNDPESFGNELGSANLIDIKLVQPTSQIVSADELGRVQLYDEADQNSVLLQQFSSPINQLLTSKESGDVFVKHFDGRVSLISAGDIEQKRNTIANLNGIVDGQSMPDSQRSLSVHQNGQLRIWDTRMSGVVFEKQVHSAGIFSIDITESELLAATTGLDWKIKLLNAQTLDEVASFPVGLGVRPVKFSNDGQLLAGGPDVSESNGLVEGTIDLWDVKTKKTNQRLIGHGNWVMWMEFCDNDRYLISFSLDGTIRKWSVPDGKEILKIDWRDEVPINCVCLGNDGQQILCGHNNGMMTVRDLSDGSLIRSVQILHTPIDQICVPSKSGVAVVTSDRSGVVTVIDVETLESIVQLEQGIGNIQGLSLDRESTSLQMLGDSGLVRVLPLPKPIQH
ncbi:MAG: hypothetical protein AAF939_18330, partial [Planctomycetota bacterium]